jgi:fumarylacetoacetate (FAA) hydrolase
MKLATLDNGTRDGQLVVVGRDMTRALAVPHLAPTLQGLMDDWAGLSSKMAAIAADLEAGRIPGCIPFDPKRALAPLPRAFQWVDGSAYVNHVELARKARGAEMPASFWMEPLVYQGGSDDFLAPTADAPFPSEEFGIDFEAEVAVVTDDVPIGTSAEKTAAHIRLIMLANDWSLRNLIPGELAKGFGFYQSKPATAFSPSAVTPDELGDAWDGGKVCLPLVSRRNGQPFGAPEAGTDMTFEFPALIAHAARTRRLGAGTIVGSGTVSNYDRSRGSGCIVERRMLEQLELGKPITPFLRYGDRIRIEMFDHCGASIFGAIDQRVVPLPS